MTSMTLTKMWQSLQNSILPKNPRRQLRRQAQSNGVAITELLETRQMLSAMAAIPTDAIQAKYQELGGASSFLGRPLSGEMATPYGGGTYEQFAGGDIFYSSTTGAHTIRTASANEWLKTASEHDAGGRIVQQVLGLPRQDEWYAPGLPNTTVVAFQGGHVWDTAYSVAHVTYGAIDVAYMSLGTQTDSSGHRLQSLLGAPISDETDMSGVPGTRVSQFQHGSITWSAASGTQVNFGIGIVYDSMGHRIDSTQIV